MDRRHSRSVLNMSPTVSHVYAMPALELLSCTLRSIRLGSLSGIDAYRLLITISSRVTCIGTMTTHREPKWAYRHYCFWPLDLANSSGCVASTRPSTYLQGCLFCVYIYSCLSLFLYGMIRGFWGNLAMFCYSSSHVTIMVLTNLRYKHKTNS